jgi:hypothetical protein
MDKSCNIHQSSCLFVWAGFCPGDHVTVNAETLHFSDRWEFVDFFHGQSDFQFSVIHHYNFVFLVSLAGGNAECILSYESRFWFFEMYL